MQQCIKGHKLNKSAKKIYSEAFYHLLEGKDELLLKDDITSMSKGFYLEFSDDRTKISTNRIELHQAIANLFAGRILGLHLLQTGAFDDYSLAQVPYSIFHSDGTVTEDKIEYIKNYTEAMIFLSTQTSISKFTDDFFSGKIPETFTKKVHQTTKPNEYMSNDMHKAIFTHLVSDLKGFTAFYKEIYGNN